MSRSMPLALDGLVGILLCDEIKHELSPSCLFSSVQKTENNSPHSDNYFCLTISGKNYFWGDLDLHLFVFIYVRS